MDRSRARRMPLGSGRRVGGTVKPREPDLRDDAPSGHDALTQPAIGPIRLPPAHELVLEQIRRSMQLGLFLPGDKLPPERDLADQLAVSRSTVREAVRLLVGDGTLSVRRGAGGGLVVNQLHVADADELRAFVRQRRSEFNDVFDFRVVIEGATAELAAQRRGGEHLDRMRERLEQMTVAIAASVAHDDPDPVSVFNAADTGFHLEIARASQNGHLQASVESIRRAMFIPIGGIFIKLRKDANEIHEPILHAIADRDGARARASMVEHVQATRRAMMEFLDDRRSPEGTHEAIRNSPLTCAEEGSSMFKPLMGRPVIVTGAGRGIGRGIALRFGQVGCRVLLASRTAGEVEKVADEIRAAGGVAEAVAADLSTEAGSRAMAGAAVERFGGIAILCANAGIFPSVSLESMTAADFDEVINANLRSAFLTVSACLPAMRAGGSGRIVMTSSITGPITGYPGFAHYGASKAGQLGFMRSAALELAASRITINALLPGNVLTEGLEGLGEGYLAEMAASVPMKRLGAIEDVANAALFFASDEAAFITGQTLVIDGGQVLPESLAALS